jgi:hypothetical protein
LRRFFALRSAVENGTANADELSALKSATRLLYGRLGELLTTLPPEEAREVAAALDRLEHVDT